MSKEEGGGLISRFLLVALCIGFGYWLHCPVVENASIPSSVFIRGHQWGIIENQPTDIFLDKADVYAFTDCTQQAIFVREGMSNANERDTLLHELLHAGTCDDGKPDNLYWNSTSQESHEGIYKISNYLSELLYENPDLVKYLVGK